jgi:hypothetical protein
LLCIYKNIFVTELINKMEVYQRKATTELKTWQKRMLRNPSFFNNLSKRLQTRVNKMIPEKFHTTITTMLKQMVRGVLFGARHTTDRPLRNADLETREELVMKKINNYRKTAAVEGGITGAGGLLLGLADFPILIGIKIKLLFEVASLYGFDIDNYKERIYILHIFELAFSSHEHRKSVYLKMVDWNDKSKDLPGDIDKFDWRSFQQEYRDYIDLAKMAQLIPGIGAPIGVIVNNALIKKLGITAMNAYRMRLVK